MSSGYSPTVKKPNATCNTRILAKNAYRSWFFEFTTYNLLFLVMQLIFIATKSGNFIQTIPLPLSMYLEIIATLGVHVGLYVCLSGLQTALMWGVVQRSRPLFTLKSWPIIIWSLTILFLFACNNYYYPLSLFSRSFLPPLPQTFWQILLILPLLTLSILSLNTIFYCLVKHCKMTLIIIGVFCCAGIVLSIPNTQSIPHSSHPNTSNIVLIGIDSLSPHRIHPKHMPTVTRFMRHSVLFEETISPLAYTSPAWATILTGLYPQHHRVRYNLMPKDLIDTKLSIVWSLRRLGYKTLFATDDRRFNNLDQAYGFQTIIGPKMGANDILLGTFNDFPLSNLLINLPIARWLFPYNYLNRASHFVYYPQTFDGALKRTLLSADTSTPYFIAVHFTLPHWPYAWAESAATEVKNEFDLKKRDKLYTAALERVDKQVNDLLHVLRSAGYLQNSLVILFSDHGEALYEPGSRQTHAERYQGDQTSPFMAYLKRKTSTELTMSAGHGSDILSPVQFHSLLAFKLYQNNRLQIQPHKETTRVALLDIAPTIQDFLNQTKREPIDGISLLPFILNADQSPPQRAFILESGMLPNQFLTFEKAKQLGQTFFTIHPQDNQLIIRKNALPTLDALKLYGVIDHEWLFALYPDDNGYIPVILNLQSGEWSDRFQSAFTKASPASNLLHQLERFYEKSWTLSSAD